MLGHPDAKDQHRPRRVRHMKYNHVRAVRLGGWHTIAVGDKTVYAFGYVSVTHRMGRNGIDMLAPATVRSTCASLRLPLWLMCNGGSNTVCARYNGDFCDDVICVITGVGSTVALATGTASHT